MPALSLSLQRGVVLAHAGADAGAEHLEVRRDHALEVAAGLAGVGFQESVERDRVGLGGVDATGGQILVGLVLRLVFLDLGGFA